MGTRGRNSVASLAIASSPTVRIERPIAPKVLTEEQAEIWLTLVNEMPAEWFSAEHAPLLAAYCKAVTRHQVVAAQLDVFDPEWLKDQDGLQRYDRLTRVEDLHVKQIASLATKLRLTQQSRYTPQAAATATKRGSSKPWEFSGCKMEP